jgi:hypothetical protein
MKMQDPPHPAEVLSALCLEPLGPLAGGTGA